ncbi:MAG: hypothetical protein RR554_09085 [Vagococcus sp.]|uniref:hypothetical protein n=1 Tax=Vagococcus sp. TaxID=1933889 RepID=UPI002FCAE53E
MTKRHPELVVMLTHNDETVENAYEIFDQCKHSKAEFWGFKDTGLPISQMKELFSYMKENGKKTVLEVVAYTEEECMKGAKMAVECGCDILMGTLFFDSINDFCQKSQLKYMPFVGKVTEHPSVLEGSVEEMVAEANEYLQKGVYGVDLLAYRYTGDKGRLIEKLVAQVDAPVCVAGSINSYQRIDTVKTADSWGFTIGGAFFENKFEGAFSEQVDLVCDYLKTSC